MAKLVCGQTPAPLESWCLSCLPLGDLPQGDKFLGFSTAQISAF